MTVPNIRRVFLVRHGQTTWNASGRAQGHTEVPLDETGRAQASAVASHLRMRLEVLKPEVELWSSDLGRARETADPIVREAKLDATYLTELRERGFGTWEGESLADIRLRLEEMARSTGTDLVALRPPSGESMQDVWQRIEPLATRIRALKRSLVVVSHGGVSSLLLARLLEGSMETARAFRARNCSVTELEARPDGIFQLLRYDDVDHLS